MLRDNPFRQFPDVPIEACELCALNSYIYSAQCLGCRVRQTARLPKFARLKAYHNVKDARGAAFARQFVESVNESRRSGTR